MVRFNGGGVPEDNLILHDPQRDDWADYPSYPVS
jgi:hypothetical protein